MEKEKGCRRKTEHDFDVHGKSSEETLFTDKNMNG